MWINRLPSPAFGFEIKYRSCAPATVPTLPTCGPVSLVHTETRPAFTLYHRLGPRRIVAHDHRLDAGGTETYVASTRCKALLADRSCPDADVVMKGSSDDGETWSTLRCVNCLARDQFGVAVRTDRSRNIVNIAYYTAQNDPTGRRIQVFLAHVLPGGSGTIDNVADTHVLTTQLDDPDSVSWDGTVSPFRSPISFRGQLGLAARGTGAAGGSHAYVHFLSQSLQGVYNGVLVPDQNNHLSRLTY